MKKSIILLLCAFLPLFAFAKIDLLVKGGIGSAAPLTHSYSFRPHLAGQLGLFLSIPFKNEAWSVETGFQWSSRTINGMTVLSVNDSPVEEGDAIINGNYLDIPVIFNFRTPIAENAKFKVGMGLFYARFLGGYTTFTNVSKHFFPDEKYKLWSRYDYFYTNNTFGGLINIGVELNKLYMGIECDTRWEYNFMALSTINAVMAYRF